MDKEKPPCEFYSLDPDKCLKNNDCVYDYDTDECYDNNTDASTFYSFSLNYTHIFIALIIFIIFFILFNYYEFNKKCNNKNILNKDNTEKINFDNFIKSHNIFKRNLHKTIKHYLTNSLYQKAYYITQLEDTYNKLYEESILQNNNTNTNSLINKIKQLTNLINS